MGYSGPLTISALEVCSVCQGLTGQGFENFTTHLSSELHAFMVRLIQRKAKCFSFPPHPHMFAAPSTREENEPEVSCNI
ncbi:unnamed protein product [Thlaspi arvense]|uniref:Uncharacterized protein n=1 Tax=Thlaspi arvense TaxID=13288 RepID=A0AAU9RA12_THLAR|nr:unnamed protein product [Thlaspi arvense]